MRDSRQSPIDVTETEQFDREIALIASELAAIQTDWAQVAGPAPGHDVRRAMVRVREILTRARADREAGRQLSTGWSDRAQSQPRAARRVVVRQQLSHWAHWWPSERRYLE